MTEKLQDLNFLHLFYFWTVVRNGGISAACESLHLTQPTISTQIRKLEKSLKQKLFDRSGRELVLTDVGKMVFEYAEDMFSVGREMLGALRGLPTDRSLKLMVGIPMVMPKLIVYRLLETVLHFPNSVQIVVHEAPLEILIADLAQHRYDVILSDAPLPSRATPRSFSHYLGSSGVAICATRELAGRLARRFPDSLDGVPMLLPTANTELRRGIDRWFDERGFAPRIVGEFDDSALIKEFGGAGAGVFPTPTAVLPQVKRQYDVQLLGYLEEVKLHYYAITLERKMTHPAVVAISQAAKEGLLDGGNDK
ncbi:transcriptional activator NhaR [Lignipirellula cremea]|uniref:Transcriptional activator protein NhaR n=1 Tax=Lignipirellula cremea TaxID=2528010 RepID=A0A518DX66_9BACT|nr:transcriptional activator NhaR [Lignipirellula cremea]QDU96419.1 Transcriptional activator protein NhaR [Lignipirellula cremea]